MRRLTFVMLLAVVGSLAMLHDNALTLTMPTQQPEAELRELHNRLEELERETREQAERGNERAVDELRQEMERIVGAIHEIERGAGEEHEGDEEDGRRARLYDLHRHLEELERETREQAERGNERAVDELRQEMERIVDAIHDIERGAREEHDGDEEDGRRVRLRELQRHLENLEREAHQQAERGNERAVGELRAEMEMIVNAIRELQRDGREEHDEDEAHRHEAEIHELHRLLEKLHRKAAEVEEHGDEAALHRIHSEMHEVEREMNELRAAGEEHEAEEEDGVDDEDDDEDRPSPEDVLIEIRDLIRDLRAEVGGLREEVQIIRERLDDLRDD